jgi:hypothetical protein
LRGSSQAQAAGAGDAGGGRPSRNGGSGGGRVAEPPGWLAALLRVVGSCRRVSRARTDAEAGGTRVGSRCRHGRSGASPARRTAGDAVACAAWLCVLSYCACRVYTA